VLGGVDNVVLNIDKINPLASAPPQPRAVSECPRSLDINSLPQIDFNRWDFFTPRRR
jgi:hypothetical protein